MIIYQSKDIKIHEDERGSFSEVFRQEWFPGAPEFVQGNISRSKRGVLRGFHYHERQWDLWIPVAGSFFVVLVSEYGLFETLELRSTEPQAILIPPGIAHGFQALEDSVLLYAVTNYYDGTDEHEFHWQSVGVDWPIENPIVSERDKVAPRKDG